MRISFKRGFFLDFCPSALVGGGLLVLFNEWRVLCLMALGVFCHEIGHASVAIIQRRKIYGLRVNSCGAELFVDERSSSYRADVFLHLGGVFFNFLLSVSFFLLIRQEASELLFFGFYFNVCLVLFHLLPIRELDGGRALFAALCAVFSLSRALQISELVSKLSCAGLLVCVLLFLSSTSFHLSLCVLFLFFFFGIFEKNKTPAV